MNENNPNRVALVTGGGTGIGAACCRALDAAGFQVGVHYRSSSASAEAVKAQLKNDPFSIQADLSTREGADEVYTALKDRGGLEVLVNNAGMTIDGPLFSAKIDDFDTIVATNMRGAWYLSKRLGRLMMRHKRGRIINMSSVVGSTGNPTQSVYGMTKAAIDNFTKTAAAEFAPYNILVNAVAPGFIQTQMTEALEEKVQEHILSQVPLGRMGTPEEVAEVVAFLATSASYCTGAVFHVNGGMYGG